MIRKKREGLLRTVVKKGKTKGIDKLSSKKGGF